jgi:hypothetical protein
MKRIVLPVAAFSIALTLFAGCSKSDTTATTDTTQAAAQSNSDSKASTTKAGDVVVPGNVNVPGGGDINKTMADAQKCADLGAAYAGLYASLMGSSADKSAVTAKLAEIKGQVPDKIKADLTTIENGVKKANGPVELSTFLASAEYTKANDTITAYLTKECNKIGG